MSEGRNIGLTARASDLLAFLRVYIGEHGTSPCYREMQDALALGSKSSVHRLLGQLVERGAIRAMPSRHRVIQLTDAQTFRLSADIAARIAADAKREGLSPVEWLTRAALRDLSDAAVRPWDRAPRSAEVRA